MFLPPKLCNRILCNSSYSSCDVCLSIRFIKERQQKEQIEVAVVTKFAALPWRFGRGSVLSALKKSLDRLGLSSVELYQLHWSASLLSLIHFFSFFFFFFSRIRRRIAHHCIKRRRRVLHRLTHRHTQNAHRNTHIHTRTRKTKEHRNTSCSEHQRHN